jgi:zinc protease
MNMKNILVTLFACLLLTPVFSQLDRSVRPQPGPAPVIEIGEAKSFTLDNGLKVFVVENDRVPRVTFSLVFDYDPMFEGQFAGLKDVTGMMLRTATKTRTKEMIDDEIDFIGASLNASAGGVFASGLARHSGKLAELIADVVINARFEQEHFDRIKTQMTSNLAAERNDPGAIAGRISRVLLYGSEHPYGVNVTEASLQNISLELCEFFHQTYIRPEITYMAVVGDVKFEEVKKIIIQHFDSWEPGSVPEHTYPTPQPPAGTTVAVFDRPNAIQSNIRVTFPVDLKPGSDDLIGARVMNSILGGSTSRLFDNLRETHGFTYGAYSQLSSDKLIGSFTAFTDVRNSATDSAVREILHEINRMRIEPVPQTELQLYKNEMNGNFALSLESPQTVANFALNIARYRLPEDYYATYLQRLAAINQEDIARAANKFLIPENAYIVIVGKAAEIAENMKQFAADGRIRYFDEDGIEYDPEQRLKPAPEGLTAADVIARYIEVLGGEKKLKALKDVTIKATTEMQGMQLEFDTYRKAPNKLKVVVGSGGMVFSTQLFDGEKGSVSSPMGAEMLEGEMLQEMKLQAIMNIEMEYEKHGIRADLMGIEGVEGNDAYKVELTYPTGNTITDYYDVESGFKVRSLSSEGLTGFADYREVEGMMFPFSLKQVAGPQVFDLKVVSVEVNTGLGDDLFKVE